MAGDTLCMCDPHFHMWNLFERPNPNLGSTAGHPLPVYHADDYFRDMETLPAPLRLVAGVHVETIVGQKDGGTVLDTVGETRWVCSQLAETEERVPFSVVAYVNLVGDLAERERILQEHVEEAGGRLRGVRMILNHHPDNPDLTWPQVAHGEFLRSDSFRTGIALLARQNLSFDLSCNPHQVSDAVATFRNYPETRVIVNHLGFIHDGEDCAHESLWRGGMHALAELPNVHMKLSMLWFGRDGYHKDSDKERKVRDLVREVIDIFGCKRCMFASNYPVDRFNEISITELYGMFLSWTADLSDDDRAELFHDTAVRAYNLVL
ncbi:MAG: amidohydrolase family protein [Gemmatimonadota bacterium]|nr:amidohydrolase family protein [Gemmatimonadota bacterium]